MIDKAIPYIVGAVVGVLLLALIQSRCDRPAPVSSDPDTLRVTITRVDTLWRTSKPRTEYVTVYTDTGANHHPCCAELDDCTEQLWTLAGTEVGARKAIDGGTVDVSFSMPVYLQEPEKAFQVRVSQATKPIPPPEIQYRDENLADQIRLGIHFGYGLGTIPGAQVGVSLQYSPWKLSDIWR